VLCFATAAFELAIVVVVASSGRISSRRLRSTCVRIVRTYVRRRARYICMLHTNQTIYA
jgi:hypothetical protein